MAYPVMPAIKPPFECGSVATSQLTLLDIPGTEALCYLWSPAARARAAWAAAHYAEFGVVITGSTPGSGDFYRTQGGMQLVFGQRYTKTYLPIRNSLADRRTGPDGKLWYKRTGVAAVAGYQLVNGKWIIVGNHGYAIAWDEAIWQDGKVKPITSNVRLIRWLTVKFTGTRSIFGWQLANAERFGLSWETQSEPWHKRHCLGDRVSQAVLDYEASLHPTPPAPEEDDEMLRVSYWKDGSPKGYFVTNDIAWRRVKDTAEKAALIARGAKDDTTGPGDTVASPLYLCCSEQPKAA